MLFTPTMGQRFTKGVKLTTTTATTIATGEEKRLITVDSINISCDTGGSTLSLYLNDGTNDYYLFRTKTFVANDYLTFKDHHVVLATGWTLRALAGTANRIDITASLIRTNPTAVTAPPFAG